MILCSLAAAYAECGRFAEAITTAQQALQLAATEHNAALEGAPREQIGFYQTSSPFRDSSSDKRSSPSRRTLRHAAVPGSCRRKKVGGYFFALPAKRPSLRLGARQVRSELLLGFLVHAVDEQNAVQMIRFVLNRPGKQAAATKLDAFPSSFIALTSTTRAG